MYIEEHNWKEGKRKAKNFVFFIFLFLFGFYLFIFMGLPFTDVSLTFFFCIGFIGGWISSLVLAPIFYGFFARSLQRKQENHNIAHAVAMRRAILLEELAFLRQVEMMKAQRDREKIERIERLQKQTQQAKERDLRRLAEQLERLKGGL